MLKKLFIFSVLIGILVAGAYFYVTQYSETERTDVRVSEQPNDAPKDTTLRITAIGDNIPHDSINQQAEVSGGYDYTKYFSLIKPALQSGDIVFCNQEGPSAGTPLGISGYPTFNAPVEFSRDLSKVGCNTVNLANNHIADKGTEGIDATLSTWEALGPISITGANRNAEQQNTVQYFKKQGITFAFVAFTDLTNNTDIPGYAVNMFSNKLVNTLLKEAQSNADFTIVSAHWGTEDSGTINQNQEKWAQLLADAGADLIIGTGPHVLQTADVLKGAEGNKTTVLYSIGNMLSTQLKLQELLGGVAVIDINTSTKEIEKVGFLPTYMHYEWSAADEAAENLLARTNIGIYPLENAQKQLDKTRFATTADAELQKIDTLLNQNTKVQILAIQDF